MLERIRIRPNGAKRAPAQSPVAAKNKETKA